MLGNKYCRFCFLAVFCPRSSLKKRPGVNKIIVKKQPYQLLHINREFFPSFDASNVHNLVNECSYIRPNIVAIFAFCPSVRGAIRRLAI